MTRKLKNPQARIFQNNQWDECYHLWLLSLPAELTRYAYDGYARIFFVDRRKTPDKYTRADVEAFINAPTNSNRSRGKPPSPCTRNDRLIILSSFYTYCKSYFVMYRGKLTPILRGEKPTTGIKKAKVPDSNRDMTEEEVVRFFAAIGRNNAIELRNRCIFLALIATGRRRAEICSLLWGDLEPVTFMENGRSRQGYLYHFKGKGKLSKDDADEWPAPVMQALQEYLEMAGKWNNMQPEDPLFPGLTGDAISGQAISPDYLNQIFRKYRKKAGLPENIVIHSFRHEHAWARYCENGHDIIAVRDALRHTSVSTTLLYIQKKKRRITGDPVSTTLAQKFSRL